MLAPNTILQDRYRIIRQLGQGGMGTVYEAIDVRLDTTVALKECHFTDEQLRKQFEREARLLARLRHPAMTRVIDHFQDSDGQFLVMDFIAGKDLSETLGTNGTAVPASDVLAWADQLLDALEYLHSQEPPVIHRDIKPQNLKLAARNQIILLDFGLAKGFAGQVSRVTNSGSIFGYTPNYAPLEQIQGTGTDPRSDLYSLAATLYHLMTGVVPPDVLTRLTCITDGQPDPLRSAREIKNVVPERVATVLNQAMAIGRNQRFAHAGAMRQALQDASMFVTTDNSHEIELTPLKSTFLPPSLERAQNLDVEHFAAVDDIQEKPPAIIKPTVASPPAVSDVTAEDPAPQRSAPTTMLMQPIRTFHQFSGIGKAITLFIIAFIIMMILKLYEKEFTDALFGLF